MAKPKNKPKVPKLKTDTVQINSVYIEPGSGVARNHCAIAEGVKGGKSLVPSMKKINSSKKHFSALSTFSGCGGGSVGMKMAGFNVLWANEFIPAAQDTYRLNHKGTILDCNDIRSINVKEVLKTLGLKRGELDLFEGSPPCFIAGTMINTLDGFKPIEDVQIGDRVLTHTQSFHRVYDVMSRIYRGDMYEIKTMGSSTTHATAEHPYYVRRKNGRSKDTLSEPEWVEAKDLKKGDYVGIAVNQLQENPEWEGVERVYYSVRTNQFEPYDVVNTLPVDDPSFWWFVGRYLGDGWMRYHSNDASDTNKRKPRAGVFVCCDKTDSGKELSQITKRLDALGMKYKISNQRTTYRIGISSKELCEFLLPFGRGAKNKEVPGFVLNMNTDLLYHFLHGYISADGSKLRDYSYKYSTISKKLVHGIAHCVNKVFGCATAAIGCMTKEKQMAYGCNVIEGRVCNVNDKYGTAFTFNQKQITREYWTDSDGIIWVPVRSVKKYKTKVRVYNISVEEDETYTANNIIVHNCKGYSTAGVREEGWNKEVEYSDGVMQRVDDLFDEYTRFLKALKPKCFIAENVAGLIKGTARGEFKDIYDDFVACGYKVKAAVIEPVKLGIPQTRDRLIFIGVRNDIPFDPVFPVPSGKIVTVKDVLPNIAKIKTVIKGLMKYVPADRASPTITASDYDTGENARFSSGGWIEDESGRRRKYNLQELRRIMTFPDDFDLTGNPRQQWERLGRSHAPLQVYRIAKALRDNVLRPYYDSKCAAYTDNIK